MDFVSVLALQKEGKKKYLAGGGGTSDVVDSFCSSEVSCCVCAPIFFFFSFRVKKRDERCTKNQHKIKNEATKPKVWTCAALIAVSLAQLSLFYLSLASPLSLEFVFVVVVYWYFCPGLILLFGCCCVLSFCFRGVVSVWCPSDFTYPPQARVRNSTARQTTVTCLCVVGFVRLVFSKPGMYFCMCLLNNKTCVSNELHVRPRRYSLTKTEKVQPPKPNDANMRNTHVLCARASQAFKVWRYSSIFVQIVGFITW